MKPTTPFLLAGVVLTLGFLSYESKAAIVITDFELTETSIRFNISGTFPDVYPPADHAALYFVNSEVAANPGFALGDRFVAAEASFTGVQTLNFMAPVWTGSPIYGDYFGILFVTDFSTGESISGTLTAAWDDPAFDPTHVTRLDLYWGIDESLPRDPTTQPSAITGGAYLASVAVPESSTATALMGGGVAVFAFLLRQRKR